MELGHGHENEVPGSSGVVFTEHPRSRRHGNGRKEQHDLTHVSPALKYPWYLSPSAKLFLMAAELSKGFLAVLEALITHAQNIPV